MDEPQVADVVAIADRLAARAREVERELPGERGAAHARALVVAAKHVRDGVELGYVGWPSEFLDRIRSTYADQVEYWADAVERERARPDSRLVETYLGAADACAEVLESVRSESARG